MNHREDVSESRVEWLICFFTVPTFIWLFFGFVGHSDFLGGLDFSWAINHARRLFDVACEYPQGVVISLFCVWLIGYIVVDVDSRL
jgi:hypothetical protein